MSPEATALTSMNARTPTLVCMESALTLSEDTIVNVLTTLIHSQVFKGPMSEQ